MAPEIMELSEFNEKADVYSFGMLIYEIISGKYPFRKLLSSQIVYNFTYLQIRPKLDNSIPKFYKKLIGLCWCQNPNERITFQEIVEELRNNSIFIKPNVDLEKFEYYIRFIDNSIKEYIVELKERQKRASSSFMKSYYDNLILKYQDQLRENDKNTSHTQKFQFPKIILNDVNDKNTSHSHNFFPKNLLDELDNEAESKMNQIKSKGISNIDDFIKIDEIDIFNDIILARMIEKSNGRICTAKISSYLVNFTNE